MIEQHQNRKAKIGKISGSAVPKRTLKVLEAADVRFKSFNSRITRKIDIRSAPYLCNYLSISAVFQNH